MMNLDFHLPTVTLQGGNISPSKVARKMMVPILCSPYQLVGYVSSQEGKLVISMTCYFFYLEPWGVFFQFDEHIFQMG